MPAPTSLYVLRPLGVGSAFCESITSYVSRLAYEHGVLTSSLMSLKIATAANRAWAARALRKGLDYVFNRAPALNGTGKCAADLVRALEKLTLQPDLEATTMIKWADVLPQRALIRRHRAWCTLCYSDWQATGQPVYDPLLWCLESVTVCHVHGLGLTTHCPRCGNRVRHLSPYYRPGHCSECHAWLGCGQPHDHTFGRPEADRDAIRRSCQIAELFVSQSSERPSRELVKNNLVHLINRTTAGNMTAFARGVGAPKNTLWLWCNGSVLPQLDVLAVICLSVGVLLSEFLDPKQPELEPVWPPTSRNPKRIQRRSAKSVRTDELTPVLERVRDSQSGPPPSLQSVARDLDRDIRILRMHFPDLCKAISVRHKEYLRQESDRRVQLIVNEIKTTIERLRDQGIYPSHRRVESALRTPSAFIEPCARNAWRQSVAELDVQSLGIDP